MKKYLLLLVLSLLFIVPIGANAATEYMRIDFDSHDKFNYFYEQKNNTPFYQFLVGQGSELKNTLSAYSYNSPNSNKFTLRIYYRSEINVDSVNLSIPDDAYYFIITDCGGRDDYLRLDFDGLNANFTNFDNGNNIQYTLFNNNAYSKIYYFDRSADYLGYSDLSTSLFNSLLRYSEVYDLSKTRNSDFTYLISKYYYFSDDNNLVLYVSNLDVVVSELYIDDELYFIDDNDNYSAFLSVIRKIFSFGSIKDYDVSETSLKFFKENIVYDNDVPIKSLYDMVTKYDTVDNPFNDDYLSVDLYTPDASSYYFVPKTNDLSLDFNLYAYTSYDNTEINSLVYDITTDTPLLLEDFLFINPIKNRYARLGFDSLLLNDGITQFKMNSNYMYYITTNTNKYPVWIYYNKNVYDVYRSDFENVTNVNTGNIIKFNSSTGRFDYNSISGKLDQETTNAKIDNFFGFDLTDSNIFKEIMNFITGFVATISSIFTCVFLVFDSLPKELQILFYFMLFSGIIIIIYNLIRGR